MYFYYTYLNTDINGQLKKIYTSVDKSYNLLKINGQEINCNYVALGNSGNEIEIIKDIPVPCYAEFDIGALQPTQIESLKLGLYNYDFDFTGTGPIGSPKSLKSTKSIQERNELIGSGIKLGWDLLTKKKN